MTLALKNSSSDIINAEDAASIVVSEQAHVHVWLSKQKAPHLKITLSPRAHLTLYCVNDTSLGPQHLDVDVEQDAQISLFDFGLLSTDTKRTTEIFLKEPNARCQFFGLDALNHENNKSHYLTIHHQARGTHSSQAFRGVYAKKSQGHFLGKVIIGKDAPLSSAEQLYKSIILSDDAHAFVLPQLEIYNHDIKASHGATIGELDHDALFYLCSRGISADQAKGLLLGSMGNDILDNINHANVKEQVKNMFTSSLKSMVSMP